MYKPAEDIPLKATRYTMGGPAIPSPELTASSPHWGEFCRYTHSSGT